MHRSYPFHDLGDDDFERLVGHICQQVLGTGAIVFAKGKDGGRDGTFSGVATKFPSAAAPYEGKFVIQAKHTSNPIASCSDRDFDKILADEHPKLVALFKAKELDHYLLWTNRKKPATKTIAKEKALKKIGVKSAHILGIEQIREWLTAHPDIWSHLGFDRFDARLSIQIEDLTSVVTAFHGTVKAAPVKKASVPHFPYVDKKTKNRLNKLSTQYYDLIKRDSVPHFGAIESFLKNPRNERYRDLYEDTASEIKTKIVAHSDTFESFDQVLVSVYDLVTKGNEALRAKRRFVNVFLHYMYFTCDIGQHDQAI